MAVGVVGVQRELLFERREALLDKSGDEPVLGPFSSILF